MFLYLVDDFTDFGGKTGTLVVAKHPTDALRHIEGSRVARKVPKYTRVRFVGSDEEHTTQSLVALGPGCVEGVPVDSSHLVA